MKKLLLLVLLLFLGSSVTVFSAGHLQDLEEYFRAASGVVIMPDGEEILVDLDAAKGVREGDLLAVVIPGEKIIHPVSGEELGRLDTVKAVLQITKVQAGYSHTKPVVTSAAVERGDLVQRWMHVPAAVRNAEGAGDKLRQQLITALPHLDWQSSENGALLVFVARDHALEVYGPKDALLNSFSFDRSSPPAITVPPATAPSGIVRQKVQSDAGVWLSPEMLGEAVGVHVGDFDGDGRLEIATAFPYRLELGRVTEGQYSRLASLELGYGQKVVGLDGADLNGDGRQELYLTAAEEGELCSLAVSFENDLHVVKGNLPWYIRGVHLPGEGRVLLGQRMGGLERDFDGPIFRIVWGEGEPRLGSAVKLPEDIDLFGFTPFAGKDGKTLYADLTTLDELKIIDAEGQALWKGEERLGGSESFIERPDPTKNPAEGPATRYAFMPARMAPGPGDTLLIPANEGSRALSRIRSFNRSYLLGMAWNGFALQEIWRTQPQSAYLADFRLADVDNDGKPEIVQALVFAREGLLSKGRSALAVFELP